VADRLAVTGQARAAVGQVALVLLLADCQAEVRVGAQAVHAFAALRGEQGHDEIAGRDAGDALADLLDEPRALVAEHVGA